MSSMNDTIRLAGELGLALKAQRQAAGLSVTDVATRAGKVRDVIYRLENGNDTTVSSLMAVVAALGLSLRLDKAGLPSLEDVHAKFGALDEDDDDAA
jgi:HTH-type transcriptional regulator / antitoxin HipB